MRPGYSFISLALPTTSFSIRVEILFSTTRQQIERTDFRFLNSMRKMGKHSFTLFQSSVLESICGGEIPRFFVSATYPPITFNQ